MGVHGLYGWIQSRFPASISNVPDDFTTKNLYIDLNGVIHMVSGNDYGFRLKVGNIYHMDEDISDNERFEKVASELRFYVDKLNPSHSLYIATDGVSPAAKLREQRNRRLAKAAMFTSITDIEKSLRKDLKAKGILTPPELTLESWDRLAISVGTDFMLKLSLYLKKFIKKEVEVNPKWGKIDVIYDDYSIPGEGEHKIVTHIRNSSSPGNTGNIKLTKDLRQRYVMNTKCDHLIISNDGDMFFLGLALPHHNVFVLREEESRTNNIAQSLVSSNMLLSQVSRNLSLIKSKRFGHIDDNDIKLMHHELMHIDTIKRIIQVYCRRASNIEVDVQRVCNDIVVVGCLLGNDFLPKLPFLQLKNHFDLLLRAYVSYLSGANVQITLKHFTRNVLQEEQMLKELFDDTLSEGKVLNELPYLTSKSGILQVQNVGNFLLQLESMGSAELQAHEIQRNRLDAFETTYVVSKKVRERVAHMRSMLTGFFLYDDKRDSEVPYLTLRDKSTRKNRILSVAGCDLSDAIHLKEYALRNHLDINFGKTGELQISLPKSNIELARQHMFKTFVHEYIKQVYRSIDERLIESIDRKTEHESKCFSSAEELKEEYYLSKFGDGNFANVSAYEYLKGVQFVSQYYITGVPSWDYSYPLSAAPLLSDLKVFAAEHQKKGSFDFTLSKPSHALTQLLVFVTETDYSYLPQYLQEILGKRDFDSETSILDRLSKERVGHGFFRRDGESLVYKYKLILPRISSDDLLKLDHLSNEVSSRGLLSNAEMKRLLRRDQFHYFPRKSTKIPKSKSVSLQLDFLEERRYGMLSAESRTAKYALHSQTKALLGAVRNFSRYIR